MYQTFLVYFYKNILKSIFKQNYREKIYHKIFSCDLPSNLNHTVNKLGFVISVLPISQLSPLKLV
jgi:hypothetical protein